MLRFAAKQWPFQPISVSVGEALREFATTALQSRLSPRSRPPVQRRLDAGARFSPARPLLGGWRPCTVRLVQKSVRENRRSSKCFIVFSLWLAERVGFVPDDLAPINDLGLIGNARTRQIH